MKLIINFSFEPHFVALYDDTDVLVNSATWTDFKQGSKYVWDFLEAHKIGKEIDLNFIGGVSGPGGFSSLRVSGAILNALGYKFDLSVHQVRADVIARALVGGENFCLNSFGDGVFVPEGKDIIRIAAENAKTLMNDQPTFVDWLPEKKRTGFTPLTIEKDIVQTTFEVLKIQTPKKIFMPDYEYPAVQKN